MDVVSAVRRGLIDRIGQERFDLWFSSSAQLVVSSGTLAVEAADQFLLDCLRNQFLEDIREAARRTGAIGETIFRVNQRLRHSAEDGGGAPGSPAATTPAPAQRDRQQPERASGTVRLRREEPRQRQFAQLEGFVVGDPNRIAHTAAGAVAARPGDVSPLFLYGPTGCGKTHLLEAVSSDVRAKRRSRVLYLSAEQFTTHFLEALRGSGLPSFRSKCREVELLAVDDLQFFAGKRATIIELQHTLDALLRKGRQLVLAADRPPAQLHSLGETFVARISGGLVCGMESADYPTRLEIARRKALRLEVEFPNAVLEMIACELGGDARQIHGTLHRLEATCLALKQPLTLPLAQVTLSEISRATQRVVRLPDIERAVCDTFGLDPKTLRAGNKSKAVSHPRMLAMWLARKYTRSAFSDISHYFGRRSHSTVIAAGKKVQRWMSDGTSIQLGQEACPICEAIQRVERHLRTGS